MVMTVDDERTLLPGSEPEIRPGVQRIGPAEPNERLHVAILLYPRQSILNAGTPDDTWRPNGIKDGLPANSEFVRGADLGHVSQILEFALECGLTVVETSVSRRRVLLSGSVAAINDALGTSVSIYEYPGGRYRARSGSLHLPAGLAGIVQSVTGI
jgi:kumamolisin